ncbi:MAG: D-alanyl-D-alanine carboxypeptidase family protein [Candidatus Dormibacterales bacterium]
MEGLGGAPGGVPGWRRRGAVAAGLIAGALLLGAVPAGSWASPPAQAPAPGGPRPPRAGGAAPSPVFTPPWTPTAAAAARPPLAFSPARLAAHPPPALPGLAVAAILVDLDTRTVLWERHGLEQRATASLAKLMTVLVALDQAPPSRVVTVPAAATAFDPADDTLMGLGAGQRWTIRELLYGVFLVSGNDAAETLARTILPRPAFIAAMNDEARRLGLSGTHFANPTGLDAAGGVSTAYDMAVLATWLLEHHPLVAAIAEQPRVWLFARPGHPEVDLVNLNKLVTWPYPGATGLKTGFTDAAGGCLVATAERGHRHLLAVVLGSPLMFTDAERLFDYGFAQVRG